MSKLPAVLLAALCIAPASAEIATTRMAVSARVTPAVSLAPLAAREGLVIDARDLARGSVDLQLRYRAESNDPRGLVLELSPRLGLAEAVGVDLPDARAVLTDAPLEIRLRECAPCELTVRYRIRLREGLRPGAYPLPWRLAARPLDGA